MFDRSRAKPVSLGDHTARPQRPSESRTDSATLGSRSQPLSLESLDRQSIAVELHTPVGRKLMLGVGNYRHDPDLGPVLQIAVSDDHASYDLMLVEGQWSGTIEPGAAYGCDFLLRIG